ncbi:helix-turn-helix domain-containing protein [Flavobacterium ginsenosidimutans]|uniref:helix-turn-helix domain-containing protein n=1 Tax=Flavobacterium ginsenosidimutans TaxID=687844 RepID=UPI000DACE5BA|nr:helix-turn-helix domain-containing protein [Flavobacterium ginsenosidimutans]KAF2331021.1 AraC family transcriptional regulator [Flavobacterium ginsenosidimutans]
MNIGKEILFFFGALGAFNGFILSLYFFFFTKKKYLTNYFLGAMLFALCTRIVVTVFVYFNLDLPKIYLQIGLSACLLIGPFLYYTLKSGMEKFNVSAVKWKLHLISWFIAIVLIGLLFPYEKYPVLWNDYFVAAVFFQWFTYSFISGFESRFVLQKIIKDYQNSSPSEKWFGAIFLGNALVFLSYFLGFSRVPFVSCIIGAIAFTFILYLIILVLLHRKQTNDLFVINVQKEKKLNKKEVEILSQKLKKIMFEKALYKNPNLSLSDLSQEINISSHKLSQFLNNNLGKNFTSFVNEFRIDEACEIITSNDKQTLESVGYDVGFNSKSTFFAAFKKHTGTTPLNYQIQALQS